MKITRKHYTVMADAIARAIKDKGDVQENYRNAALTPKRCRWDYSYAAKLSPFICDNVYKYANDSHVDTALRSIMRDNGMEWAAQ